uniref:Ig-like domain-containing protein n=1 Tax=Knipowitschia caucasica TaxID=637954 RepID=A0AAV2L7Q6_KNICA
MAVSWTLGAVTATPAQSAEVGQSLNLSCSLSTAAGDTIHQVRWLRDGSRQTLLAYRAVPTVHLSHQEPAVLLWPSPLGSSHISIQSVKPEDEGCFLCMFDVYPSGQQEGKTCVTVTGKVNHKNTTTAIAGKPTTFTCSYTLPARVQQVLWRRTGGQGQRTTLASYSKHGHQSIDEAFVNRVTLSKNLGDSAMTMQEVKMEDEACYTCEFHTYPDGTKSAATCLVVYVLPKAEVSHTTQPSGAIEASCSARAKPSVQMEWDFGGDNRALGTPVLTSHNQSDGTITMTSSVLLKSGTLGDVRCVIHHPGMDEPLTVSLTNDGPAMSVLLWTKRRENLRSTDDD